MPIYQQYARFYDGSGHIRFAVIMGEYLMSVLQRHLVPGRRVLDLACGTGTLALYLAERGWDVVGLDRSAAMLEIARAKATTVEWGANIRFVQGDMRQLPPEVLDQPPFDLVTCTYDSLNYLLNEQSLAACFASVAWVLRPGGAFIADMNTPYFLQSDGDRCEALEYPGFFQVSQSSYEAATMCSTLRLTWFVDDDRGHYTRFDETHIERAYPFATLERLLDEAGLDIEAVYDCFTFQPPHEQAQRLLWVARQEAGGRRLKA